MESQMGPVDGLLYVENPGAVGLQSGHGQEISAWPSPSGPIVGHDGEEESHDKKSVLKKVKDKAKKLQNTLGIKKHNHEGEEEVEEGDEIEDDPEIHGALVYESAAISQNQQGDVSRIPMETQGQSGVHYGESQPFSKEPGVSLGESGPFLEDPDAPKDGPGKVSSGNYQSKVKDPTNAGGEEIGGTTVLESLSAMKLSDDTDSKRRQEVSSGTHNQFAPENPKRTRPSNTTTKPNPEPDNTVTEQSRNDQAAHPQPQSYTSLIYDKATSAKNLLASKLGYAQNPSESEATKPESDVTMSESGNRSVTGTVTEKITGAKNGCLPQKLPGVSEKSLGESENLSAESDKREKGTDKGVSIKDYVMEKLKPGDEDRALSEVITEVIHKGDGSGRNVTVSGNSGDNRGSGMVGKVKGAVTSLFGSRDMKSSKETTESDVGTKSLKEATRFDVRMKSLKEATGSDVAMPVSHDHNDQGTMRSGLEEVVGERRIQEN
ncbi:hypothetical protein AMTRI_Chr07g81410 [Amborella trichopoda]